MLNENLSPLRIDTTFRTIAPRDRLEELITLVEAEAIRPEDVMIRIFQRQREFLVRRDGTDRSDIDTNDTRITKWDQGIWPGLIQVYGLNGSDVLHLTWLEREQGDIPGTKIFLNHRNQVIKGGYGVAIYDTSKFDLLWNGSQPTDLYAFKDVKNKRQALLGIVMEPYNSNL